MEPNGTESEVWKSEVILISIDYLNQLVAQVGHTVYKNHFQIFVYVSMWAIW